MKYRRIIVNRKRQLELVEEDLPNPRPGEGTNGALTARQHDVLHLLAAGLTNKEAADRLHLSPRTVEMHVAALLDRLNSRTRTEAIRRAGDLGLLEKTNTVSAIR